MFLDNRMFHPSVAASCLEPPVNRLRRLLARVPPGGPRCAPDEVNEGRFAMTSAPLLARYLMLLLLLLPPAPARAQLTGTLNFLVLRVQFKDMTGSTYTAAQTQAIFDSIKTLWGTDSSYGAMTPNFRISGLYNVPQNTSVYVDVGNNSSS